MNKKYPRTFLAETRGSTQPEREKVFDPSLRQYAHAFRLASPNFEEGELKQRWRDAQSHVFRHLLRAVADTPWHDSLILRGSLLLKFWLGDAARDPGDMDWVIRPPTAGANDPETDQMIKGIIRAAERGQVGNGIVIEAGHIAVDDIWTYERAPGKRVVIPWYAAGLPGGAAQMDFVFNETLRTAPVLMRISLGNGTVPIWTATAEESLAWKLLWLETDDYPQGKDLYDAVLLAESHYLPWNLLRDVLRSDEWLRSNEPRWEMFTNSAIDWDNFKREYPSVAGSGSDWQKRLQSALVRTLAERDAASQ